MLLWSFPWKLLSIDGNHPPQKIPSIGKTPKMKKTEETYGKTHGQTNVRVVFLNKRLVQRCFTSLSASEFGWLDRPLVPGAMNVAGKTLQKILNLPLLAYLARTERTSNTPGPSINEKLLFLGQVSFATPSCWHTHGGSLDLLKGQKSPDTHESGRRSSLVGMLSWTQLNNKNGKLRGSMFRFIRPCMGFVTLISRFLCAKPRTNSQAKGAYCRWAGISSDFFSTAVFKILKSSLADMKPQVSAAPKWTGNWNHLGSKGGERTKTPCNSNCFFF